MYNSSKQNALVINTSRFCFVCINDSRGCKIQKMSFKLYDEKRMRCGRRRVTLLIWTVSLLYMYLLLM